MTNESVEASVNGQAVDRDQLLREIPLFSQLSDETMGDVLRRSVRRSFASDEIVILEGAPCRAVYFVVHGEMRASRVAPDGREQVLTRLGPGETFNTVPALGPEGKNHATVEAQTPSQLIVIAVDDFRQLVQTHADLAFALLQDFATRLDHLTDLVEALSLHTVRVRLARFLLERADEAGTGGRSLQRWTQDEIAAHLGTVRDVVGRTLRSFVDTGLIRIDRYRIVLLDRAGLEEETKG